MSATVGVILNPRAGKDIRRHVAHATARSDASQVTDLRRVIFGAFEGGADRVVVARDMHGLSRRAVGGLDPSLRVEHLDVAVSGVGDDTARAAAAMQRGDVDVLVVIGGDGTHRDVCRGWPDAPIVSVGCGTTNAFASPIEPTVAGTAAGLAASSELPINDLVAWQSLVIHVDIQGQPSDIALTNLAVLDPTDEPEGSVWTATGVRQILAAVAEPWSVGIGSVAGLVAPTSRTDDRAVFVAVAGATEAPQVIRAPVGPGSWEDVGVSWVSVIEPGQRISIDGPAVLALDGECQRLLMQDQRAVVGLRRSGLRVLDVRRTFAHAVRAGTLLVDTHPHELA